MRWAVKEAGAVFNKDSKRDKPSGNANRTRNTKTRKKGKCSVQGCNKPILAKGLCSTHYRRERYKKMRQESGRPYKPRAGIIRTLSDLRRKRRAEVGILERSVGTTPGLIIDVLLEEKRDMAIDEVCKEVAKRLGSDDPLLAANLRGRVRHFLYTNQKIERVGRGTFRLK